MAKVVECKHCSAPFEMVWGRWALKPRKKDYCSGLCRRRASRERERVRAKANGWDYKNKRKRALAIRGRQCKWEHCQVDDEHHITLWNSPLDQCPSCYRQIQRVAACKRCGGPQYHYPVAEGLQCPNCFPRLPEAGEILVVLVCSATGREREIVRRPYWRLPDGRKLSDVADEGVAVLDLEPKTWAKYRK